MIYSKVWSVCPAANLGDLRGAGKGLINIDDFDVIKTLHKNATLWTLYAIIYRYNYQRSGLKGPVYCGQPGGGRCSARCQVICQAWVIRTLVSFVSLVDNVSGVLLLTSPHCTLQNLLKANSSRFECFDWTRFHKVQCSWSS